MIHVSLPFTLFHRGPNHHLTVLSTPDRVLPQPENNRRPGYRLTALRQHEKRIPRPNSLDNGKLRGTMSKFSKGFLAHPKHWVGSTPRITVSTPRRSWIAMAAGPTQRIRRVLEVLEKEFPDASCSLNFTNPLELLVATILSAQCTDERVNQVTKDLFKKYRTARDYATVPLTELEKDIQSTGFYRNKARNIRECCRILDEKYGGKVPPSMDDLVTLPGVGRKTANVVLGTAYGIPSGVVVDTHVARISQRLGLTTEKDPEKIEQDLMRLVPQDQWIPFGHRMIKHGRKYCTAKKPRCSECPMNSFCPKIGVEGNTKSPGKTDSSSESKRGKRATSRSRRES